MRAQDLMDRAKSLMGDKAHDYTKDAEVNQFENFDRVAVIVSWFKDPTDQPFAVLIGTKLARLATLLNGKSPKNESITDSFLDLINYSALWGGKRCEGQSVYESHEVHAQLAINLRAKTLFHEMWGKASVGGDYNKQNWFDLQSLLGF